MIKQREKKKQCRDRKMAKFVKILTIPMLRKRSLLFGLLDQQFEQAREINQRKLLARWKLRLPSCTRLEGIPLLRGLKLSSILITTFFFPFRVCVCNIVICLFL